MEAPVRTEDGADFADIHREDDGFEFIHVLPALEEAEVDLFLRLVTMLLGEGIEVSVGLGASTKFTEFPVELVSLL